MGYEQIQTMARPFAGSGRQKPLEAALQKLWYLTLLSHGRSPLRCPVLVRETHRHYSKNPNRSAVTFSPDEKKP